MLTVKRALILLLCHAILFHNSSLWAQTKGESIWTETEDGRQIHLLLIRSRKQNEQKHPIILCHGIGAQGTYWYFNEESSWAYELAEKGFDVFVPDLRGVGKSKKGGMNFSFYDYSKDVSAIIEKVKKITGSGKVHWIGHSMGGMVIYLAVTENPNVTKDIATFTAISSPYTIWIPFELFDFLKKNYEPISRSLRILEAVPFSVIANLYGFALPALDALEGFGIPTHSFQYFIWNFQDVEPEIKRNVVAGTADISSRVLEKFFRVSLGYEEFGFDLRKLNVPSLFVVGSKDLIATPPTVRLAYLKTASRNKSFVLAGGGEGFSTDYGHVDVTVTSRSKTEILPIVLAHILNEERKRSHDKKERRTDETENGKIKEDATMVHEKPKPPRFLVSLRREAKYSFLLIQDFGLNSEIWRDFTEHLEKKNISFVMADTITSPNILLELIDFFCKSGTSSYNIGVMHGLAGSIAMKLRENCLDAIFLIAAPIRELSSYYRMYAESGGRISQTVIRQIFGEDVKIHPFSPLHEILDELLSADFLVTERQKMFFILSTGTRTQYWWDIGETPSLFKNFSSIIVSHANFMEDASHLELVRGKKARRYVIPYVMSQIASLKK